MIIIILFRLSRSRLSTQHIGLLAHSVDAFKPNQKINIKSPETIEIIHPSAPKIHYDKGYPSITGRNPVCYKVNRNHFPFYQDELY